MCSLLGDDGFWDQVAKAASEHDPPLETVAAIEGWFLPNLWLGVSVESQKWARARLDKLAATTAGAVRFASCEPLLGELDLGRWLGTGLDWVIAGGESGPGARPIHPHWARSLRDQCAATAVPFFFKQWGAYAPEADGHNRGAVSFIDRSGVCWDQVEGLAPPDVVRMRRVGKGCAGRLLDGRTWDEFPAGMNAGGGHG
jgi:protein gp37